VTFVTSINITITKLNENNTKNIVCLLFNLLFSLFIDKFSKKLYHNFQNSVFKLQYFKPSSKVAGVINLFFPLSPHHQELIVVFKALVQKDFTRADLAIETIILPKKSF
jgi:uncharacterized membrane protein YczE